MHSNTTILIVDDTQAQRYATSRTLQAAGFQVREAGDGHQALFMARERPDVILLDVKLPDIDGFEVCRRIKADPETAGIPIIQTSANFISGEHRLQGLQAGADDYIIQPISPEELVAKLNAWLRLYRAETELRKANERLQARVTERTDELQRLQGLVRHREFDASSGSRPAAARYGIAVAVVLIATLVALALAPHTYSTPFLLFCPAVIIAVWLGGFWPGMLATVLSSLAVNYFMLPPHDAFNLDPVSMVQTVGFALIFASVCWFGHLARQRLRSVIDIQSQLLEMSFDPVIVRDAEDRVIYWNKGAESLYGWSKDEARGRVTHQLLRTVHPKPIEEIRAELNQTGRWHGELAHTRKDGSTVAVDSWWTLQKQGNRQSAILEANYDLTERKKAEESLRYLSAIVESSDAAIIGKTLDGIITSWNSSAERLYGYSAAEMIGQPISRLSPRGHPNEFPTILKRLSAGERIETYDTIRQHKDGTIIDVALKVSPILDQTGRIIGASSIARDIRKRRRAERKIEELNQTLQQRNAELDAERSRWQGVVEGIADEVWVCDAAGRISLINLPDLTQMDLPEFKDKSITQVLEEVDILYPDGRPRPPEQAPLLRALRGEICRGEEIMRHRATGNTRCRQFSCAPTRDAGGSITGAVAIVRDITEHRRTEEALRRSEQRLRNLLDSLFVFVGVMNLDGTLIEANRAALVAAGIRAEDVIGKKFWDCYWWNYRPEVQEQLRAAIERARLGQMVRYDVPVRMADGLMTIDFALTPMRDQQGTITHLIPSGVDISERKRAEEALRRSEARLRAATSAAEIGVWYWTPGTDYIEVSANWRQLFGIAPDAEVTFETWRRAIHPEDRERAVAELNAASEQRREFNTEYRVVCPGGSVRWIVDRGRATYDQSGLAVSMAGINVDITDRKRAQEALVKNEKLASVGRMAATIAHEINNPLAAAMNALYLVAQGDLPETARGPLQLAEHELERVAHITKQTLGFYREAGTAASVQLPEVIDGILSLFAPKLKNRALRVERKYRGANAAYAVEGEIRQMISNLIANSIDAMPQHGTLYLRTNGPICLHGGRPMVRLTIADTGSGISPETAPRIFEPFFTTKAAIGTGLGLWVTKELITKHEGRIRMRSQVGKGTVFTLWLPSERRHDERIDSVGAA